MQASIVSSSGSVAGVRIEIHSATCTASSSNGDCYCHLIWHGWTPRSTKDATFEVEPKKPPKYDPGFARLMWARDILQETSRPKKRPYQQVQFNQVSRLRPVRPRYLSRKR